MPNNVIGEKVLVPRLVTLLLLVHDHMSRVEEELRRVETNSVELAMDWLFSHLEDPTEEDDEHAQDLSLSLGNSEVPKENANEKGRYVFDEEKPLENPPLVDILSTCMNLLQSTYAIDFSMIDLIVNLCS